ncbi:MULTISPECIES: leucine-rich repeat domain-containing protein [unclassified Fusibacter]|uniref:leucine-rich repeat domain-containing protein n=1 Tax=unclassified Fusibacter TaxID=2624464 RepID=UPI001012FDF4|nr:MULTISPECIES: leucine-rich repeat domain-containing protein [unclassified Fusibacter]MCK8058986.1 leucine-rich repeat domain-containing protein [Fusibacter sp. A2]NPE22397.1 leucine-rich repeat domain-containing protein [Fusibacter sp. A1]RXV60504.1 leucine-rich repeat domain-containing protein [Fusibacter sp. A1]
MLNSLLNHYDIHLERLKNLQWNECGYTLLDGNVSRIGFYGMPLKSIADELFELGNLEMLSLIHNQLKEIPSEIAKLSKLRELYLGGNELTSLPDDIGKLKELNYLYVIEESLKRLPRSLAELQQLEELVIRTKHEEEILMQIKIFKIKAKKIVVNDKEVDL